MPPIVTIVGSYNVGFFLKGSRLPMPGETIIADAFKESGGGKGSNQAVAAALLGAETRFIGRLGDDKYGAAALELYRQVGISTDTIKIDKTIHSGISVILINKVGQNLISVVPGANLRLSRKDIDSAERVLRRSYVVGFQLENDHETVFYGLKKCHDLGIRTFLDPAPAVKLPPSVYPCLDFIKPNETEASLLSGLRVKDPGSAKKGGPLVSRPGSEDGDHHARGWRRRARNRGGHEAFPGASCKGHRRDGRRGHLQRGPPGRALKKEKHRRIGSFRCSCGFTLDDATRSDRVHSDLSRSGRFDEGLGRATGAPE